MEMETQAPIEKSNSVVYDGYSYETQFFGFTPRSLVDGVYEALSSYGTERLKVLETQLIDKKTVPANVSPEQISKAVNSILDQFNNRIKNIFERFEEYVLKNLLFIPPHVLLPEDKVQVNQYTKEEEQKVDLEIEELKKKIVAEEAMKAALDNEHHELDLYCAELVEQKKHLEALSDLLKLDGNFHDQLNETLTKSSELHTQISKTLKSRMLPLKGTGGRSLTDSPLMS